jgi:hypothetical protein
MKRDIRLPTLGLTALLLLSQASLSEGGGFGRRRVARVEPTTYVGNPANANAPSDMLGTFYSTPTLYVRGDFPTGKGYSPLGQYGLSNLTSYGPISAYRSVSAPVRIYSRGYNGQVVETEATSTSNPFLAEPKPVIYPNADSYYYKPRRFASPPWWQSGINWVDQN